MLPDFLANFRPLPGFVSASVFVLCATFLVHVLQRILDNAANTVEPAERHATFARFATSAGCMVWALDLGGMFLYPAIAPVIELYKALLGLLAMVIATRFTIPALVTTRSRARLVRAAALLAVGMVIGHALITSAFGTVRANVHGGALLASLLLATMLATILALRHRAARLRALETEFAPLSLSAKLIAGLVILVLHILLARMLDLHPTVTARAVHDNGFATSSGPTVAVLMLLGLLIAADQLYSLRLDDVRHHMFNHAMALVRSIPVEDSLDERHRLALIAERLPALLKSQRLELHYQPIHSIIDGPCMVRFETLLRQTMTPLGLIGPETFFVACERLQLATKADRLIIEQSLEGSRAWCDAGACKGISVNVCPATLLECGFVDWMRGVYKAAAWPAGWLQLELTEHAMISHPEDVAITIRDLSALGVQVVMDDFGAGFSSLGVLVDLPITGIKCDRSFVNTLQQDRARQTLLTHICHMASDLGLSVTVEGVETHRDLDIVRACGATHVQGYVFAQAMPLRDATEWLMTRVDNRVPALQRLPSS